MCEWHHSLSLVGFHEHNRGEIFAPSLKLWMIESWIRTHVLQATLEAICALLLVQFRLNIDILRVWFAERMSFILPGRYMKYLYPFECEKKGLSSPGELQAAIDSNRREGRRPSYTNSLYRYCPSPSSAPHSLLSSCAVQNTSTGHNGLSTSASPKLKKKSGLWGL